MPDGFTHILLGLIAVELLSLKYDWATDYRSIVLIGAMLPDLGNFKLIAGEFGAHELYYVFLPFHSIIGALLLITLFTLIFKKKYWRKIFPLLSIGVFTHLFGDYLIKVLDGYLPLFFPFTFERFGFQIFISAGRGFIIVASVTLAILIINRRRKIKEVVEV